MLFQLSKEFSYGLFQPLKALFFGAYLHKLFLTLFNFQGTFARFASFLILPHSKFIVKKKFCFRKTFFKLCSLCCVQISAVPRGLANIHPVSTIVKHFFHFSASFFRSSLFLSFSPSNPRKRAAKGRVAKCTAQTITVTPYIF